MDKSQVAFSEIFDLARLKNPFEFSGAAIGNMDYETSFEFYLGIMVILDPNDDEVGIKEAHTRLDELFVLSDRVVEDNDT